jgi:hypothetical protein
MNEKESKTKTDSCHSNKPQSQKLYEIILENSEDRSELNQKLKNTETKIISNLIAFSSYNGPTEVSNLKYIFKLNIIVKFK